MWWIKGKIWCIVIHLKTSAKQNWDWLATTVAEFVRIDAFLCTIYETKDPEHSFAKAFSRMHSFNMERTLKIHVFGNIMRCCEGVDNKPWASRSIRVTGSSVWGRNAASLWRLLSRGDSFAGNRWDPATHGIRVTHSIALENRSRHWVEESAKEYSGCLAS